MLLLPSVTLLVLAVSAGAQNPPGVPPRQQQQQQHHHQQPPVHNQQQFEHQQQNVQEGHGHGGHGTNKLRFQSEIHNADHIIEHLQNVIKTKPKEQMSEEELEFHYFKMHDYDNNNKLDGVEIGKALTHFHDEPSNETSQPDSTQGGAGHQRQYKTPQINEEELEEMIDDVMDEEDVDRDGYIDYMEFTKSQKRRGEFGDGEKPYNPEHI